MRYVFRAFVGFTLLVAADAPTWTIQAIADIDRPCIRHAGCDGSDIRLTRKPTPDG